MLDVEGDGGGGFKSYHGDVFRDCEHGVREVYSMPCIFCGNIVIV